MTKTSADKTTKAKPSVFKRFCRDNKGSTAIEYGMIGSLVAVAIISGVSSSGESIGNTFTTISNSLSLVSSPAPSSPSNPAAPLTAG